MNDIKSRNDIVTLINTFYTKVRQNPVIGYIFNDIAKVNWKTHLPKMYSFWASMLVGEQTYSGNPMVKHIELSKQTAMSDKEFSEWIFLFNETVDELFIGDTATEAKLRAANIARLMLHKIQTA